MKTYEQSVTAFKAWAAKQDFDPSCRDLQEAFIAGVVDAERDAAALIAALEMARSLLVIEGYEGYGSSLRVIDAALNKSANA